MKLYHATDSRAKENIEENGLWTSISEKASGEDIERGVVTSHPCVYGFTDISDAIRFGYDNFSQIIICEFDVNDDEVEPDREYGEGEAYTIAHNIDKENIVILDEDKIEEMGF